MQSQNIAWALCNSLCSWRSLLGYVSIIFFYKLNNFLQFPREKSNVVCSLRVFNINDKIFYTKLINDLENNILKKLQQHFTIMLLKNILSFLLWEYTICKSDKRMLQIMVVG